MEYLNTRCEIKTIEIDSVKVINKVIKNIYSNGRKDGILMLKRCGK